MQLNIESYCMQVATKNKSKNLITRQRALYEWILGNANLWAGHRSLNVGHLAKPFFRQIKERRKNMQQTVYNPQKGRLETIWPQAGKRRLPTCGGIKIRGKNREF